MLIGTQLELTEGVAYVVSDLVRRRRGLYAFSPSEGGVASVLVRCGKEGMGLSVSLKAGDVAIDLGRRSALYAFSNSKDDLSIN